MNDTLSGRSLTYARRTWVLFALTLVILQLVAQVAAFHIVRDTTLSPAQIEGLQAIGVSGNLYLIFNFLLQLSIPILWGSMGLLIFWRKSDDRGALILSAMMIGLGMASSIPTWKTFAAAYPTWVWVVAPVAFISNFCLHSFFFVFPNGRYVPRWSIGLGVAASLYNILNSYAFALPAPLVTLGNNLRWFFPIFVLIGLIGFLVPFYRYRWVSTPIEREQIKWVVLTIVLAIVLFALTVSTVFLIPGNNPDTDISFITVFVQPMGWGLTFQLIPIAIAIAILRYRLFDIDIIIRRTVQYSLLTGLLGLVYFGSVVLFQGLFRTASGETSSLAVVLSTLIIAALFAPLRRRVQNVLDRRFFRQKYDAAKVLADFARTARDETDINQLTGRLVEVVQQTLQPEQVSLWLKPTSIKRWDQEGNKRGQESVR